MEKAKPENWINGFASVLLLLFILWLYWNDLTHVYFFFAEYVCVCVYALCSQENEYSMSIFCFFFLPACTKFHFIRSAGAENFSVEFEI